MKGGSGLARAAAVIALLALIAGAMLMAGAGLAYRTGLLPLGTAFDTLRYGVFTTMGAGVLGTLTLIAGAWGRRMGPALTGALIAVGAVAMLAVPYGHWQQAQHVPPIHDITTDTRDPPAFVALVEARQRAPNAVDYPGEDTARQQREAYPDIGPLRLRAPLSAVRKAAVEQVHAQDWELAAVSGERIEATATTRWFGFRDDVVIRLREENDAVRVDMRSASRVGRSDVGANAARIRAYLDALERRVAGAN